MTISSWWPGDPEDVAGRPPPWMCGGCGASLEGVCARLTARCQIDAELVQNRLEVAGATLLAMRGDSPWPASLRSAMPDFVRDTAEAYGYNPSPYRLPPPSSIAISAMDRTWQWLSLIPQDRHVLRRIVACRALVHPLTGRYVLGWRKLGRMLGAHHSAIIRWHGYGIDELVQHLQLRAGKMPATTSTYRYENREA